MKNNYFKIALLFAALVVFALAIYIYRPATNNLTRVTVLGESQTKISPDSAVIVFSVVTQNSLAVNAQQENARKSEAVINSIKSLAADAEIKTSDYNLQPERDYSGKMPRIVGYEARNSVTVTVSDMNQTGTLIDAATKAGANSVEGISFVVRENSPARGAALASATKQAMAKAESIAQSLNGKIVRIVETQEGGVSQSFPNLEFNNMAANTNSSTMSRSYNTPLEAGSLNVRSQTVLVAEIEIKNTFK
jgi:uncharacterized protein YggE